MNTRIHLAGKYWVTLPEAWAAEIKAKNLKLKLRNEKTRDGLKPTVHVVDDGMFTNLGRYFLKAPRSQKLVYKDGNRFNHDPANLELVFR
jgi:hypothetical protein